MKSLLLKFVIFVTPILVIAYPLDVFFSKNLETTRQGDYSVWSDIYDGKIDAEIAIYGTSQSVHHINPQILSDILNKKAYNFGIAGLNFNIQHFRHQEYLKRNKKPQIIIHSIDNITLSKQPYLAPERDRHPFIPFGLTNKSQFLPYMMTHKDIYKYTHPYQGFSWCDYFLPLIRYIGNSSEDIVFPIVNQDRINGYSGLKNEWNVNLEKRMAKTPPFEASIDPDVVKLYEGFLNECRNSNIKVILVRTPEYTDLQNFVLNRNEVISIFKDISERHNLTFLDFSSDPICFDKKYFRDPGHLNTKGAELLSEKLAHELKKIL